VRGDYFGQVVDDGVRQAAEGAFGFERLPVIEFPSP